MQISERALVALYSYRLSSPRRSLFVRVLHREPGEGNITQITPANNSRTGKIRRAPSTPQQHKRALSRTDDIAASALADADSREALRLIECAFICFMRPVSLEICRDRMRRSPTRSRAHP